MSNQKKWKKFETLVANIQKTLAPKAKITQNEKIMGKRSKVLREVDITVRQKVGQYEIFIAIDCKDYKKPVDVKDIESFISMVEDIDANKGAMVSPRGFTQAAKNRAKDSGINLYRLVDAEKHDWQTYVSIPVLYSVSGIKLISFKFSTTTTGPFVMKEGDPRLIMLFTEKEEPIDSLRNLLIKKWNEGLLPEEEGEHRDIKLVDIPSYIKTEGKLYQVEVMAKIIVEKKMFFGQLPLTEIKGFADEINGGVTTKSFTTAPLSVDEIEAKWKRIKSERDLSVKPVLNLFARNEYAIQRLQE